MNSWSGVRRWEILREGGGSRFAGSGSAKSQIRAYSSGGHRARRASRRGPGSGATVQNYVAEMSALERNRARRNEMRNGADAVDYRALRKPYPWIRNR